MKAFVDCVPKLSVAGSVGPGLVVLRSFGKFFGMGGLRLGFAIADVPLARQIRQSVGPWAVSGPALAIGRRALTDREWIEKTQLLLEDETRKLDIVLTVGDLSVTGGTPLFRLVTARRAWSLYEFLGRLGILVRPFAASPRWLRFGLPPSESARLRLREALVHWTEENR